VEVGFRVYRLEQLTKILVIMLCFMSGSAVEHNNDRLNTIGL